VARLNGAAQPPAPVEVRVAGPDDWMAKRDLRLSALRDAPYAFYSTYEQAAQRSDDEWRAWPRPPNVVMLAWRGDEPVGIVGIGPNPRQPGVADLFAMWVAPPARGNGVADHLIAAALARATDLGCVEVVLEVTAGNDRARRFYERHGFVPFDAPTSMDGAVAMRRRFA